MLWALVRRPPLVVLALSLAVLSDAEPVSNLRGSEGDGAEAQEEKEEAQTAEDEKSTKFAEELPKFEEGTAFWDSIFSNGDAITSLQSWLKAMDAPALQAWQKNVTTISSAPIAKEWATLANRATEMKLKEVREMEASYAAWGPHGRDRRYGPQDGDNHEYRHPGEQHYNPVRGSVQEFLPPAWVPPLPGTVPKPGMETRPGFRPGRVPSGPGRHLPYHSQSYAGRVPDVFPRGDPDDGFRPGRIPSGHRHLPVYAQSYATAAPGSYSDDDDFKPGRIPPGHPLPVYGRNYASSPTSEEPPSAFVSQFPHPITAPPLPGSGRRPGAEYRPDRPFYPRGPGMRGGGSPTVPSRSHVHSTEASNEQSSVQAEAAAGAGAGWGDFPLKKPDEAEHNNHGQGHNNSSNPTAATAAAQSESERPLLP
mmetsp:Transcript_83705/g.175086  ORF Transcript_83705/g.175086 Transcript_83705/m.175086 type:complete len:422 (-) Transcript_83705:602-1867(-)